MYLGPPPEEAKREADSENASPCHYWCNLTQTVVGPDDGPTHPGHCTESRPCYES